MRRIGVIEKRTSFAWQYIEVHYFQGHKIEQWNHSIEEVHDCCQTFAIKKNSFVWENMTEHVLQKVKYHIEILIDNINNDPWYIRSLAFCIWKVRWSPEGLAGSEKPRFLFIMHPSFLLCIFPLLEVQNRICGNSSRGTAEQVQLLCWICMIWI